MKALLIGSIGTLSDTSELQREAFNAAFAQAGLDWHWDRASYRAMLAMSGGRERIERHAALRGAPVDSAALHEAKSVIFRDFLDWGRAQARPGIIALIDAVAAAGLPVALIATTAPENVDHLLAGLGMTRGDFSLVVDRSDVAAAKPAPDCYHLACARLALAPECCLAVEDNPDGVRAARGAGTRVLAWPNANTAGLDFGDAPVVRDADIRAAALEALGLEAIPAK